mgnify:CR=1 FL=1
MGATYKLKRKLADGTLEDVVLQGAGSAEPFIVTFTNSGNNNYTIEETYEDIEQAFANGKIVIGVDSTNSYIYQIFGLSDDDTIPFSRIVNWGAGGAVVETLFVNTDDSVSYAWNTLATTALATATSKGLMSAVDKKKVEWLDLDTSDGYIFTIGDDSVTSARIELNNNDNSANVIGDEAYLRSTFGSAYVTSQEDIYLQAEGDIMANGKKVCTANMSVPFIPSDAFTVVAGSTSNPTKWSVANVSGITGLTDGMTIAVRTPNGGGYYGVMLSIDGGNNYYPIVRNKNTTVSNEYPQGSTIILAFNSTQTLSVYSGSSTTTTVTGCWQIADSNDDRWVYQRNATANANYPMLFRETAGTTSTSTYQSQIQYSNSIYANPSTGTIYANDFVVDGKSIVGGGGGADYDNVYVGGTTSIEYDGDGITWDGVIELISDDGIVEKPISVAIPLVVGDGIEFTPNSAGDRMVISATNTGGGSSSGGGQPLYRHCIKVYESGADAYEIFLQIVSTSASPINTEEQFRAALGEGEHPCICSGTFNLDGSLYRACAIFKYDGEYYIYTDANLEGYNIPLFGNIYYDLRITDTVNIIGTASVGGGVAQLQQSVTYAELKSLRDNGELVAGMQYRITDFVTTTSQPDTKSAGHQFDIIVTALSNNTLSENASADYHSTDGGVCDGCTFIPDVLADEDGNLDDGSVKSYYYVFEDFTEGSDGTEEGYKATDEFIAYDYLENGDGIVVPVIYKTDAEAAIDAPEEFGEPDYADIFYYDGTMKIDGVTYDKWRKICETQENGPFWDGRTGYIWALTNQVVIGGGSAVDTHFANANLPAWEIKYCLDNDKTRFAWAVDEQMIVNLDSGYSNGAPLTRQPSADGRDNNAIAVGGYYYAWGTQADVEEGDSTNFYYSKSETLTNGETVFFGGDIEFYTAEVVDGGKGVIYYMKDEWGNECPYDFKNIQFKRYAVTATQVQEKEFMIYEQGSQDIKYAYGTSLDDCTVDSENSAYYYTFSYVLQTGDVQDLTIVGNKLRPDYEDNCVQNKVGIYILADYEGDSKLYLSNNVCVTTELWYIDNDDVLRYSYNTFGDYCHSNTFGNECYSNTFGNYCTSNTFGDICYSNTFGDNCYSNTFGNICYSNTFGNDCYSNTFGNGCYSNTFGNGCTSNTFGNYCYSNTFGISCDFNTLSGYAQCNIFENRVCWVTLTSPTQGNYNNYIQNITVSQGVRGKTINATRNLDYKTTYVARGSVTTEV